MGIWFWIILFTVLGAWMLWKGMQGNNNHSFLADMGRLLLIFAWWCFLGFLITRIAS